ncbi:unnamed protein product [Tuber aestivum]|uniref:Uncharacterized protein n=1 Tax=Tuber aestivum TaxID=59557 RepID=A0A292Q8F2_9PEZI|nr:unnamed protein product [Tuber aestivum]
MRAIPRKTPNTLPHSARHCTVPWLLSQGPCLNKGNLLQIPHLPRPSESLYVTSFYPSWAPQLPRIYRHLMLCVQSGTRSTGEKEMPQGYLSWWLSAHFLSPFFKFALDSTLRVVHCSSNYVSALLAPILLLQEFQHARTTVPPLQARKLGEQGTRGNRRLLHHRRPGNFTRKPVHSQEARSEEGKISEVSVRRLFESDNKRGCFSGLLDALRCAGMGGCIRLAFF